MKTIVKIVIFIAFLLGVLSLIFTFCGKNDSADELSSDLSNDSSNDLSSETFSDIPEWYSRTMTPYYGVSKELPVSKNIKDLKDLKKSTCKIAVFMVATPEIMNYAEYALKQNSEWCKKHSYDFFFYEKKAKGMNDLPINFSKMQYAIDLLDTDKYDYVMYIDADAIVVNTEYDVRNLIDTFMSPTKIPKKSIMFGEDCYGPKECSKPGRINSGVFIVKPSGREILKYWIDSSRGKCNKYVNVFPNCQLIFTNCVFPRFRSKIAIIPFNLMNGFKDALLIKHAMAQSDMKRIDNLKQVYIKNIENTDDRIQVY